MPRALASVLFRLHTRDALHSRCAELLVSLVHKPWWSFVLLPVMPPMLPSRSARPPRRWAREGGGISDHRAGLAVHRGRVVARQRRGLPGTAESPTRCGKNLQNVGTGGLVPYRCTRTQQGSTRQGSLREGIDSPRGEGTEQHGTSLEAWRRRHTCCQSPLSCLAAALTAVHDEGRCSRRRC